MAWKHSQILAMFIHYIGQYRASKPKFDYLNKSRKCCTNRQQKFLRFLNVYIDVKWATITKIKRKCVIFSYKKC